MSLLPYCMTVLLSIYFLVLLYPKWVVLKCICLFPELANVFPQILHTYGLSPVWILIWSRKIWPVENPLPQWGHLLVLCSGSVWKDCICLTRCFCITIFPHWSQAYLVWDLLIWLWRHFSDLNLCWHWLHGKFNTCWSILFMLGILWLLWALLICWDNDPKNVFPPIMRRK